MIFSKRRLCFASSFLLSSLVLGACANQGAPEGGPYDTQAPRLLQANPAPKATQVRNRRLVLTFDEYIKLASDQEKIIISPAQIKPARITTSGHSVVIHLEDSLKPNTTYSFYFDDVISDNNEDNALEHFGYLFSTGDKVDSMQISGRIVDALTYEPISDLLIGAFHPAQLKDSTLTKEVFPFVSKTNKMGEFTLRGLPDSTYQVFAINDKDRNYRYNEPSEGLAFDLKEYRTSLKDSLRTDTIRIDSIVRRDTLYRDSLVTTPYTYYYPDNISLRYSIPQQLRKGLERHSRIDSLICRLEFLTEPKQLPIVRSLDKPEADQSKLYWATAKGQVVDLWLRDPELIARDSVRFALSYERTDSLQHTQLHSDTLTFLKPRLLASKGKNTAKGKSPLQLTARGATGIYAEGPMDSLILTSSRPLAQLPKSAIKLQQSSDSVYHNLDFELKQDTLDRLSYSLSFERNYGRRYQLTIDSAAVQDFYGASSDSLSFRQSTLAESDFGVLSVTLQGVHGHALVQLLDKNDAVLQQRQAIPLLTDSLGQTKQQKPKEKASQQEGEQDAMLQQLLDKQRKHLSSQDTAVHTVTEQLPDKDHSGSEEAKYHILFRDLKPGDYFLRLIIDLDENGAFTPGEYPKLPEDVYYCPQTFAIKKGFTTEERWDIRSVPADQAKPEALRKAKPDVAKKQRVDKNIEYYKRWGKRSK